MVQRRRKKKPGQQESGFTPPERPAEPEPAHFEGRPPADFEPRDGDSLTVKYDGASLTVAPYSSVKLDFAIYSRQLRAGDDAAAEFDRIYRYLEKRCLAAARDKLGAFAAELKEAQKKTGGG